MDASLQASNGPPRTARRMIDSVQRIGSPLARALDGTLAREAMVLSVGGEQIEVEVERQERPRGGCQGYWHCPRCDRRCCHLYVLHGAVACRLCHGPLDYRSRHTLHPALIKAAKIRRRIGAGHVLSAIPKRPPRWRRDYWERLIRELAANERVIADMLGATLRAVKRQKARLDGRR